MKHFGIRFHAGNAQSTIEVGNIQLLNSQGENILTGGVSNSTTNSAAAGSSSVYAFDGDNTTKYVTTNKESRLTYTVKNDFVGSLTKLIVEYSGWGGEAPVAFDLQYSEAGNPDIDSDWVTIQSFTGLVWAMNETKLFELNAVIQADPTITAAIDDKLRLNTLKNRVKAGYRPTDDEAVFLMLGDSKVAASVMTALDGGARYDDLRALGVGDADSLRILALYNVQVDVGKYQSEQKMALLSDPLVLNQFKLFLESRNLSLPPFDSYLVDIRANAAVYAAARDFMPT